MECAGPNAVSEVALLDPPAGCTQANARANYWYDANGNQVGRQVGCSGQTQTASDWMDYSIDNLPRQIARMPAVSFGTQPNPATIPIANNLTRFHYGPDGQRTLQSLTFDANNNRRVTVYAGAYERDTYAGPSNPGGVSRVEHRYAIAPGVLLVKNPTDSQRSGVHYVHTDRLGSTSTVTRSDGSVVSQNGFDAFGMPRSADWGKPAWGWTMADTTNGAGFSNPSITRRGFTDHEQLDQLGLTHMNGRMYDYRLGRFLGVDPIIQFPTNSQSLNPYSYVLNNPLSGTDPTGYYSECGGNQWCWELEAAEFLAGPRASINERMGIGNYNGAKERQDLADAQKEPKGTVEVGSISRSDSNSQVPSVPDAWNVIKGASKFSPNSSGLQIVAGMTEDAVGSVAHLWGEQNQGEDGGTYTKNWLTGEQQSVARGRVATAFTALNLVSFGAEGTVVKGVTMLANELKAAAGGIKSLAGLRGAKGVSVESGVGGSALMTIVRIVVRGEKIESIVNEGKALTFTTGNEHALVTLANGQRALVSGGPGGIDFLEGSVSKIFGHTHPTNAPPSAADAEAMRILNQVKQWVFHGGEETVVRPSH